MKFSTICVAALAALVQASPIKNAVSNITLAIETDNEEIKGQGIGSVHVGAGISYWFLADATPQMNYDPSKQQLYYNINEDVKYSFSVNNHFATVGVLEPYKVEFEDNYLKVNGTIDGFFACNNVDYPYGNSGDSYAVMNHPDQGAPENCIPLKVKNTA